MKRFVLFLYGMLLLTACSHPHAEISETAGVGRVMPTKNPETETEITETDALPSLTRDTSGLSDLSDLTAVYGVPFPDAGNNNDWFFGKTTRNPQTGDVTYVWERSQDTLDLLEKYNAVYRGDETRDDANQPPVDETLEKVKLGLHPGAVFLLHPESTTNTSMLGDMIDWIRSVGYEILPICDIT